jgi:hypothetical protein
VQFLLTQLREQFDDTIGLYCIKAELGKTQSNYFGIRYIFISFQFSFVACFLTIRAISEADDVQAGRRHQVR